MISTNYQFLFIDYFFPSFKRIYQYLAIIANAFLPFCKLSHVSQSALSTGLMMIDCPFRGEVVGIGRALADQTRDLKITYGHEWYFPEDQVLWADFKYTKFLISKRGEFK